MPHRSRLSILLLDLPREDHAAGRDFWAGATGRPAEPDVTDENWSSLGSFADGWHVEVQRTGTGTPPRWHVDIETDDVPAEVGRLEALGAERLVDMGRFLADDRPGRSGVLRGRRPDRRGVRPLRHHLALTSPGPDVDVPAPGRSLRHSGVTRPIIAAACSPSPSTVSTSRGTRCQTASIRSPAVPVRVAIGKGLVPGKRVRSTSVSTAWRTTGWASWGGPCGSAPGTITSSHSSRPS